jgi:hypothetical protein
MHYFDTVYCSLPYGDVIIKGSDCYTLFVISVMKEKGFMKKLLLIVVAACSLAACKKNGVPPTANIVGKWELHERKGGNIIPQDTIYKAGNGNIYQFNSDSTYGQYTNGTLIASGTFHMQGNNLYLQSNEVLYNNDNTFNIETPNYMASISGNALIFTPYIADIATVVYDKIQN